ncbi:similar to Saccharomyces cerevisiae YJR102C VPS25 Component of the ESCRT-II complex, which is involved in ubiquitin-dependent sorting of proteins into the endosome [Maudiozyma barnettii]|uniref:Similar to Saccharomyces cerevisiae YJR102C VPS25 Component of the ESCRT-II complex, which is involved in ubiquitin-dependent sorting of proteins into the endosome n=1 Tax=Maudiozyma barnettii TaxID=61262 RepID=A0A8H2VHW3_9SACH|nr:ESCRT-II subunit protein VPS25 [Kazachstania barnettii]CAB4255628.1 similar to Saccharomyces cerevisiae YJR102C VPS25 Component of the ESCRT-II complex, which is involved in ubiquitin-dependent sorting of proteins into the endosome [Kazachstania barnettii]CAD1784189.1 similar to Saccharomyces cerevisiae YJR102C VPS25 Component of the ESCRT-II complex, which is involved in ubiquitin-dependent sorting of proteins into the endosome [Kazachstania barnettii]
MEFPPIYSFPPLYTRQPNAVIRNKQIDSWIDIILSISKQQSLWEIDSQGNFIQQSISLFENKDIDRTVSPLFIKEILQRMVKTQKLVARDDMSDSTYCILWKNLDSWASLMLEWFETTNKLNQVVTIYELTSGDESIGWEFHSMPDPLVSKCLNLLVKRGRATMLKDEYNKYIAIKVV